MLAASCCCCDSLAGWLEGDVMVRTRNMQRWGGGEGLAGRRRCPTIPRLWGERAVCTSGPKRSRLQEQCRRLAASPGVLEGWGLESRKQKSKETSHELVLFQAPGPAPKLIRFLALMSRQQWRHGGYWLATFLLDGKVFINVRRPRLVAGVGSWFVSGFKAFRVQGRLVPG